MNALQQEWLTALRSGNYQQGRGTLRTRLDDGTFAHCCLGVLCDVVEPEAWVSADVPKWVSADYGTSSGYASDELLKAVGLNRVWGLHFATLNDRVAEVGRPANSFEFIADALEEIFAALEQQ